MNQRINKTLERILNILDRDIDAIESTSSSGAQLDTYTAQTLCRYSAALAAIKSERVKDEQIEKKELQKLSTPELIEIFQKARENKNDT